jgi:predicted N-acyltransferase
VVRGWRGVQPGGVGEEGWGVQPAGRTGDGSARAGALLGALDELAARERAVFTKVEHLPPAADPWPGLDRAGYHRVETWDDAALEIVWPSFDAYLGALPRRKRKDVAKIRQRAAAQGIEVAPLRPTPEAAPRLGQLMDNVLRRHGSGESFHPEIFLRAQAILGADLVVLAIRREGELAGCTGLLISGDEATAKWPGLDYERTWGTVAYLSLWLEVIAHSIARGVTRLRMGAKSYETKRHLGAVCEPRAGALLLRGRLLNRLAGAALGRRAAPTPARSQGERYPSGHSARGESAASSR